MGLRTGSGGDEWHVDRRRPWGQSVVRNRRSRQATQTYRRPTVWASLKANVVRAVRRIFDDANDWAVETMSNPRYPFKLFQRMVTVSLETTKIVKSLPHLDVQQTVPASEQLTESRDTPDALAL